MLFVDNLYWRSLKMSKYRKPRQLFRVRWSKKFMTRRTYEQLLLEDFERYEISKKKN